MSAERLQTTGIVDFHVHYDKETVISTIELARTRNVVALGLIGKETIPDPEICRNYIAEGVSRGIDVILGIEANRKISDKYIDLIALSFDINDKGIRKLFGKKETLGGSRHVSQFQERFLTQKGFVVEASPKDKAEQQLLADLRDGIMFEKAIHFCRLVVNNPVNDTRLEEEISESHESWGFVVQKYGKRPYYINDPLALKAKFLWYLYFAPGKEGFLPTSDSASDVIKAVHDARGVVLLSPEGKFDYYQYRDFLNAGGDGIMAWHGGKLGTNHGKHDIDRQTIKETLTMGKLILGGSDYSPDKNHWEIGHGNGMMHISSRRYQELMKYRDRR